MVKKEISLSRKVLFELVLLGIFWVIAGTSTGIAGKQGSKEAQIIAIIAFMAIIIFKLMAFFVTVLDGDEMSEKNYEHARAMSYTSLLQIIVTFGLVNAICGLFGIKIMNNWYAWVLMFIGWTELSTGIRFFRSEEGGD